MTSLEFTKGDFGFNITLTLTDADGTAVDLSDGGGEAVIKFKMAIRGAAALTVDGTCTVSDATSGICYYTVAITNFDVAGIYDAEVEATWSGTARIQTWKFDRISIKQDLPLS